MSRLPTKEALEVASRQPARLTGKLRVACTKHTKKSDRRPSSSSDCLPGFSVVEESIVSGLTAVET